LQLRRPGDEHIELTRQATERGLFARATVKAVLRDKGKWQGTFSSASVLGL
jgi:dihydrodipicolinate reductase